MKRVDIQFADRAPVAGWYGRIALLAGMVCLAASLWSHRLARMNLQQVASEHAEVASALTQRQAAVGASPLETIPPNQIVAINGAIAQLNLPWTELFAALESAQSSAIALVTLEPDARTKT